jgi:hypothetical protein
MKKHVWIAMIVCLLLMVSCSGTGAEEFFSEDNGTTVVEDSQPAQEVSQAEEVVLHDLTPENNQSTEVSQSAIQAEGTPASANTSEPDDVPKAGYAYTVVDTGQAKCYSDTREIPCPQEGEAFYGQNAQYAGVQPSYKDNGDGTVIDLNTGLMWQKTPDLDHKVTYVEAVAGAATFELAGYDDWRLPSIKELYSLIDFNGNSRGANPVPYIDTDYFDFQFGDESGGERIIDAQYWSSTEYVGTTMNGAATVFGVNFADGRIKGYPRDNGPRGSAMTQFVRYVRGNPDYGINNFVDNGDGTVTDLATGLTWMKADSGIALNWEEALEYAENLEFAGYDDWRLPNAKELQSIVDYTRAPDAVEASQQGPAIDPIFEISESESWFWTSTTHLEAIQLGAVYITFGQAFGYMTGPSGNTTYMNVHGAGAQRSDPKSGDPSEWPAGHGPQGDEIRIYNYLRLVRCGAEYGGEETD